MVLSLSSRALSRIPRTTRFRAKPNKQERGFREIRRPRTSFALSLRLDFRFVNEAMYRFRNGVKEMEAYEKCWVSRIRKFLWKCLVINRIYGYLLAIMDPSLPHNFITRCLLFLSSPSIPKTHGFSGGFGFFCFEDSRCNTREDQPLHVQRVVNSGNRQSWRGELVKGIELEEAEEVRSLTVRQNR